MTRGTVNHLALTLSSLAELERRFYAPVLGFLGYEKIEDIPQKMTLWLNRPAQTAVNLWQAEEALRDRQHERYAPGFHHFAFGVDSRAEVDELHKFLESKAIRVLEAPAEYPQYAPGYYAVFFEDPDGLKFEAVHMPTFDG